MATTELDKFLGDFLLKFCNPDEERRWVAECVKYDENEKKNIIKPGIWTPFKLIETKQVAEKGAFAITTPSNIIVVEPEPLDKDKEKQKKLIEKAKVFFKKENYLYASVFSGGQSEAFWIPIVRSITNEERKRIMFWLCNKIGLTTDEMDMSGCSSEHPWCIPGVFRISKNKNTELIEIHEGKKLEIPIFSDDEFMEMKKTFGIVDIKKILQGIGKGERDSSAIKLATYYRKAGNSQNETLRKMMDWNLKNTPPLSEKQLSEKVKSAFKKTEPYEFIYSEEPPKSKKAWEHELANIIDKKDKDGEPLPRQIKNNMIINLFVKWLSTEYHFIVFMDTEDMLIYKDGYYQGNGRQFIEKFVQDTLNNITFSTTGEGLSFCRMNLVREIVGNIIRMHYVNRENVNPKDVLCLRNGMFDLKRFMLIEHTPKIKNTTILPIVYDANADCPQFKKFLSEILDEKDIPVIQELFGYCLFRDYRWQNFFMLQGGGMNGKGTLLKVLREMLGNENVSALSLHDIEKEKFMRNELYGKMANISGDISSSLLTHTNTIKMLTGDDLVQADVKNKSPIKFDNVAKLIFSGNELPDVTDNSAGFWRRPILVVFSRSFFGREDTELKPRLLKELSGIFNWSLIGLKRLFQNNGFSYFLSVDERMSYWKARTDSVKSFVEDCIEQEIGIQTPCADVYNSYQFWCSEKNVSPYTNRVFGKKLRMACLFPVKDETIWDGDKSKSKKVYIGLHLRKVVQE